MAMRSPLNGMIWTSPSPDKKGAPSRSGYTKLDLEATQEDGTYFPDKTAVVKFILEQSDEDVITIFNRVLQSKPQLRKEFGRPAPWWSSSGSWNRSGSKSARSMRRFNGDEPVEMDPTPRPQPELALCTSLSNGPLPTVQFSCPHYFVSESDADVEVGLIRIGDLSGHAQVAYETYDISARSGHEYQARKGTVMFRPGEAWQFFKVGMIENEEWNVTQVFGVKILKDNTVGAQLSRSLLSTHVHVINNDSFPTNKYQKQIVQNEMEAIPPLGLLLEYLKLQYSYPEIRKGSKKLIVVGQMQNLYFMAKLCMNMYLLKNVFHLEGDVEEEVISAKHGALVFLALMQVIPFAAIHYLEWYKFEWKVGGMSRTILQKAILRKYLTCDAAAKKHIKDGVLIMGIASDTQHLVGSGYMGFIGVVNSIGALFVLVVFQICAPFAFHTPPRAAAFLPMVIFPIILCATMVCRNQMTIDLITSRNDQESDIVDKVVETTKDYQLILDFDCRGRQMETFQTDITAFNKGDKDSLQLLVNNAHFAPWVTVLFLAGYLYKGGCEVIHGDISLAIYLTNVAVFTQMGLAYGHILTTCVEIQTSFPALRRITKLLNVPSDDNQRMRWIRSGCDTSARLVKDSLNEMYRDGRSEVDNVPIDMLRIWVRHLSLNHKHTFQWTGEVSPTEIDPTFVLNGAVEFNQGRLISIIGPHAEGKSTLVNCLGGVIMPDAERCSDENVEVFIPCHLRVIHIPHEPCFFRGSLMDNMTYGVRPGDPDGDKSRVKAIFRHIGLPGNVIALLEEGSIHFSNWFDVLSHSQRHMLSIVRALVANPQVICIHKPTEKYSEDQGKQVLGVLKLFVEGAGLEQDQGTISKRKPRPRTCIMSNTNLFAKDFADDIFFVSREGMRKIDKELVREDMIR